MTKQRPRRVGLGMQPRQGVVLQEVKPGAAVEAVPGVSATVVHLEEAPEVVSEGVETGAKEEGLKTKAEELQEVGQENLAVEAEEAPIVAQNDVLEPPQFKPLPELEAASAHLAAMLEQSKAAAEPQFTVKPIPGREFSNLMGPSEEQLARSIYYDGNPEYAVGVDYGIGEDRGAAAIVRLGENGSVDELVEMLNLQPIGELPNGDYRSTVRIAECYVEGCRQQAEADGISLEDWLTGHLASYLENWWSSPGAK